MNCENSLPTTPTGWGVCRSPEVLFITTTCCGEPLEDGTSCFGCGEYVLDRFPRGDLITDCGELEYSDLSTLSPTVAMWTGYPVGCIHVEVKP